MAAHKSSAVADQEPIDVLFALHPKFDLLDFAGPAEVFTTALHDFKDSCEFSLVCSLISLLYIAVAMSLLLINS